jgi:hypothetical protein
MSRHTDTRCGTASVVPVILLPSPIANCAFSSSYDFESMFGVQAFFFFLSFDFFLFRFIITEAPAAHKASLIDV